MKKRLIFTLLYEDGHFVLSRNFRTQRIGGIAWLNQNYDFSRVAFFIDELIVLNVSRGVPNHEDFCETVKEIARGCFVPISAGGGIRSLEDAQRLFESGADKVVVNRALYDDPQLLEDITSRWGRQCAVGSIDARTVGSTQSFFTANGQTEELVSAVRKVVRERMVGEFYLTSIDKDGTGQGLDLHLLEFFQSLNSSRIPTILAGGAGKPEHLITALTHPDVGAVATANLLNFVGDGLKKARDRVADSGIELATWDISERPV